MKKTILVFLSLPLLAGCLSNAPRAATNWTLEPLQTSSAIAAKNMLSLHSSTNLPIVRLGSINVCEPYNTRHFVIIRPNGSFAFDPMNEFAATPSLLIRSTAENAARTTGLFSHVITHNSMANANQTLELSISRLAIDCREKNERRATISLSLLLSSARAILAQTSATASVLIPDDQMNFSEAFSKAFEEAFAQAAALLPRN